jgi:DNA-binding CsgD family transcriptional regulator
MWKRRLPEALTEREREVFELLRRGLTNEEIAGRLNISVAGAKYHVSQILSKLGVVTREEAAAWCPEERGWYWKLGWLTGAGLVIAAPIGLGALLLDPDGSVDLESEIAASDDVTGATHSTPVGPTSADARQPPLSASATPTRVPVSTSASATLSPMEGATSELLPSQTDTPGSPATELPTPPPTATDGGGVPGGAGKIAFESGDHIYVMAHDGSGRTSIITNSEMEFDEQPAWSPDGTKIAFTRGTSRYVGSSDIYVAGADGSAVTRLTNLSGNEIRPTWSPDGSRIAFLYDTSLWVMNADGSAVTMIYGSTDLGISAPSWSPVGSRIVFHGYSYDHNGRRASDIFTVNDDGSQLTRLTNDPANDALPAWSPDGARIAFVRAPVGTTSVYGEIHVMNADGSNQVKLADNGTEPAWSPDGGTIAFTRRTSSDLEIFSVGVDGTNEVNLTNSPSDESSPAWQPVSPHAPPPTDSVAASFPIRDPDLQTSRIATNGRRWTNVAPHLKGG